MANRGSLTDPVSWGQFVQEVGIPGATILALLALLGYLAFAGVPAVISLTNSIQRNTDMVSQVATMTAVSQSAVVEQQKTIIANESNVIKQNADLLRLIDRTDTRLDSLEADRAARDARNILRGQR